MGKAKSATIRTLRNQLTSAIRLRKALIGILMLAIALGLLLGPKWEGDSTLLLILSMFIAFISLGLAYTGLSQAIMGWSKETEIDFDKQDVRHYTASLFGRSRPFTIAFLKIDAMEPVKPEFSEQGGISLQLKDNQDRVMMTIGLFDDEDDALMCKRQMLECLQKHQSDPS
ncbi:MAG: hypothetical protein OIF56_11240 [Cohaesibacter sp.]|nr:hypothetical protein [Cohaesibacter sp.]MCV6601374.1 hypothetical protein [Cohaesibacter sp.]